MSFDTLYTLAKKLEVKVRLGSTDTFRDWYRRYPAYAGRVATLRDEELFPPDPEIPGTEALDAELPEFNQIEGLSLQMTQAMNHYQQRSRDASCLALLITLLGTFCTWHREHLNSKGAGPKNKEPTPTNPPPWK